MRWAIDFSMILLECKASPDAPNGIVIIIIVVINIQTNAVHSHLGMGKL
jgi:hypothetical protein